MNEMGDAGRQKVVKRKEGRRMERMMGKKFAPSFYNPVLNLSCFFVKRPEMFFYICSFFFSVVFISLASVSKYRIVTRFWSARVSFMSASMTINHCKIERSLGNKTAS